MHKIPANLAKLDKLENDLFEAKRAIRNQATEIHDLKTACTNARSASDEQIAMSHENASRMQEQLNTMLNAWEGFVNDLEQNSFDVAVDEHMTHEEEIDTFNNPILRVGDKICAELLDWRERWRSESDLSTIAMKKLDIAELDQARQRYEFETATEELRAQIADLKAENARLEPEFEPDFLPRIWCRLATQDRFIKDLLAVAEAAILGDGNS